MSLFSKSRVKKIVLLSLFGTGVIMAFQNCSASDDWRNQLNSSLSLSSVSPSIQTPGASAPSPSPAPAPVTPPAPSPTPASGTVELITDPLMQTGFQETDACPSVYTASCATPAQRNVPNGLYPAFANQAPKWTLQQWGSRTSLYGGGGYPYGDGLVWSIGEKHIATFPGGIFEMGVNGYEDWLGQYRQTQPQRLAWPSFTLGFTNGNIGNPSATPGGNIARMLALNFAIDARLVKSDRRQQAGYDPNQNTLIFVAFVSIQNLTAGSAGYGQYVWLGIPIYNDLEQMPSAYVGGDTYGNNLGTGMLIYNPGYSTFASTSLWSGQWVHLAADLLPHARAALDSGLSRGLLKDSDRSHYYVGGFTIGFEVTGLNETSIQFKGVSIKATR